eukprot:6487254-Pyramimonas_sp.AAC.1
MASAWNRSSESLETDSSFFMKPSTKAALACISGGSLEFTLVALFTVTGASDGSPILETFFDPEGASPHSGSR